MGACQSNAGATITPDKVVKIKNGPASSNKYDNKGGEKGSDSKKE